MNESTSQMLIEVILQEISGIHIWHFGAILAASSAGIAIIAAALQKKGTSIGKKKLLHIWLTLAYFGVILLITVMRRGIGERERSFAELGLDRYLHIHDDYYAMMFVLLNVLLFIPWGILVSHYCLSRKHFFNIIITTALGFICSLGIECIQLITETGYFEGADILANTIGTFLGALIGVGILIAKRKI